MKFFDTFIRAFVMGNLGDDLFIITLCNRYPHTKFVMCGEKAYRHIFSAVENLTYVTTDTFFHKWVMRVRNIVPKLLNCCWNYLNKINIGEKYSMCRWNDFLANISKNNILISGSIFIEQNSNTKFVIGGYQKNEIKYYRRHPYIVGCNFGPYHNEEYRNFYAERFKDASQVCFRDSYSFRLFQGKNIQWAPDILFQIDMKQAVLPVESDYILISVLNLEKDGDINSELQSKYHSAIEVFIENQLSRGERIVLIGFCNAQGDNKVIETIMTQYKGSESVQAYNYPDITYQQALGYIANAKLIVASRYHAMILGWVCQKKVLPIVYNEKMTHVIEDLNPGSVFVTLDELTIDETILISKYDKMIQENRNIEIERIIEEAKKHFEKIDDLLGSFSG